jgi:hypothetical protein
MNIGMAVDAFHPNVPEVPGFRFFVTFEAGGCKMGTP